MDTTTATGAPRFAFTKPPLGRAKGVLAVGPTSITIEHPLLKQPVEVPLANLVAVARDEAARDAPDVLLRRDPKALRLGVTQYTKGNLILLFREPVPFGRSKFGSEQLTGLSSRERRRGTIVDLVTLSLADPALALAELRSRGVTVVSSLSDALVAVIGVPDADELADRQRQVARARRRGSRGLLLWGVFAAGTIPLRFVVGSEMSLSRAEHIAVWAVPCAALAAVLTFLAIASRTTHSGPTAPRPDPSARRQAVVGLGGTFGLLGAFTAGIIWAAHLSGPSQSAALGLLLGAPSGAILGFAVQRASAIRRLPEPVTHPGGTTGLAPISALPAPPPPPPEASWVGGPVGPVPKRRLRRTVGISAAVLVGAFVALCALGLVVERFDRSPDDRLAARATIGASRLPADWSTHEGEGTKGDGALDAHICGNAAGTLPDHTGSYDRQFGYRLGHGVEYAHLDVGVLISPTAADAEREFVAAREAGPTYRSCVMARAIELSRYGSPQETGQPVATFSRLRDHRVVGVVDQIQVTTPTVVGPRVTFVAFVRMQIDRAIVRMPVTTWGRPMALDDLLPIIEAERHQVVSALSG